MKHRLSESQAGNKYFKNEFTVTRYQSVHFIPGLHSDQKMNICPRRADLDINERPSTSPLRLEVSTKRIRMRVKIKIIIE